MEKVCEVLVIALAEMLQFLVLIVHHLMLIIKKLTFFVLGEGPNDGNNDSTGVE